MNSVTERGGRYYRSYIKVKKLLLTGKLRLCKKLNPDFRNALNIAFDRAVSHLEHLDDPSVATLNTQQTICRVDSNGLKIECAGAISGPKAATCAVAPVQDLKRFTW